MTNALVFLEACTRCGRVGRAYLGRRLARRTPLVCDACLKDAQKTEPARKRETSGRRRQG